MEARPRFVRQEWAAAQEGLARGQAEVRAVGGAASAGAAVGAGQKVVAPGPA